MEKVIKNLQDEKENQRRTYSEQINELQKSLELRRAELSDAKKEFNEKL